MRDIVDPAPIAIFSYGLDLKITDCSAPLASCVGCDREDLVGMDLRYPSRSDLTALAKALQGEEASFEGTLQWPVTRESRDVTERIFPLLDDEGRIIGGAVVVLDSRALDAEDEAEQDIGRDSLTGLPDRRLLMDRLRVAVLQAERGASLSVVALDIGRTKEVAATVGLLAGERLQQMVAEHLTPFIRSSDSFGCLGEDLFAVVVPGMKNVGQVVAMTSRLLHVFDGHWDVDGHQLILSPGIGVATYPEDGADAETLLAHAVGVAFRAGREDPTRPRLFNADRQAEARERLALEVDLRRAVEREEFVLHYQPQVAARVSGDRRITGFEALLRWQHPTRGLVPPDAFVPIAEQTRLILPLGAWVLRTACAQLAAWNAAGLPPVRMAVNLAAPQLEHDDIVELVAELIDRHGLDPATLELELTERVAFLDEASTSRVLDGFKRLGARITLDDFGTGYASASLLTAFPFDTLKIDRAFVAKIDQPSRERLVTEAVIGLAHQMGLTVVAEGVETREQLAAATQLGADEIQGYFYSRPLPAPEAGEMLRAYKAAESAHSPSPQAK